MHADACLDLVKDCLFGGRECDATSLRFASRSVWFSWVWKGPLDCAFQLDSELQRASNADVRHTQTTQFLDSLNNCTMISFVQLLEHACMVRIVGTA
jgi:hypothetical protein